MATKTAIFSSSVGSYTLPSKLLAPSAGLGTITADVRGSASDTPSQGLGKVGNGMRVICNFAAAPGSVLTIHVGSRDGTKGHHHGGAAGGALAGAGGGSSAVLIAGGGGGYDTAWLAYTGTTGAMWGFEDAFGATTIADLSSNPTHPALTVSGSVTLNEPSIVPSDTATCALFAAGAQASTTSYLPTFSAITIGCVARWATAPSAAQQIVTSLQSSTNHGGQIKLNASGDIACSFSNGTSNQSVASAFIPIAGHSYQIVTTWDGTTVWLYANDLTTGAQAFTPLSGALSGSFVTPAIGWIVGNNTTTAYVGRVVVAPVAVTSAQVTALVTAATSTSTTLICEAAGGGGPGAANVGGFGGNGGIGGWSGGNGSDGVSSGASGGGTPGKGGGGASTVQGTGGLAGTGGTGQTGGSNGSAGLGGAGGIGSTTSPGGRSGGGGGGGTAGGGGGGGGGVSQYGGGGGGGSSFLSPSATLLSPNSGPGAVNTAGEVILTYLTVDVPFAPKLLTPANQSIVDLTAPSFTFTYEPAQDSGSLNAISFAAGATGTTPLYWNNASNTFSSTVTWIPVSSLTSFGSNVYALSFPVGAFTNGNTYVWQIATQESYALLSGPQATSSVTGAAQPTVTVTAPVGTISTPTFNVGWTATFTGGNTQQSYRVIVYSSDQVAATGFLPGFGSSIYDTGSVASTATQAAVSPILVNGEQFYAAVQVVQTGGAASNWALSPAVTTAWYGPPVPILNAIATNDVNTGQPIVELSFSANLNLLSAADSAFQTLSIGNWTANIGTTLSLSSGWASSGGPALAATTTSARAVVVSLPAGLYTVSGSNDYAVMAQCQAPTSPQNVRLSALFYDASNVLIATFPVQSGFDQVSGITLSGVVTAPSNAQSVSLSFSYTTTTANELHQFDNIGVINFVSTLPAWSIGGWATSSLTAEVAYSDDGGVTWHDVLNSAAVPVSVDGSTISGIAADYATVPNLDRLYSVQLTGVSPLSGITLGAGTLTTSGWSATSGAVADANQTWWLSDPSTPGSAVGFDLSADFKPNFHEAMARYYPLGRSTSVKYSDGVKLYDAKLTARTTSRTARDAVQQLVAPLDGSTAPPVLYLQSPEAGWWMSLDGDRAGSVMLGTIDPQVPEHFDFSLSFMAAPSQAGTPFTIPGVATLGPPAGGGGGGAFENLLLTDSTSVTAISAHKKASAAAESISIVDTTHTATVNLGQYDTEVQSFPATVYWPMEDPAGTTLLADASGGGHPLTVSGVTLGAAGIIPSDSFSSAQFGASSTATSSFVPSGWTSMTIAADVQFTSSTLPAATGVQATLFDNSGSTNGCKLSVSTSNIPTVTVWNGTTSLTLVGTALLAGHSYLIAVVWFAGGTVFFDVFDNTAVTGGQVASGALAYGFNPVNSITVGAGLRGQLARVMAVNKALSTAQMSALATSATRPGTLFGVSYESVSLWNSKVAAYGSIPIGLCYYDGTNAQLLSASSWQTSSGQQAGKIGAATGAVCVTIKIDPSVQSNITNLATNLKAFFAAAPKGNNIFWSYYAEPEDNISAGQFTLAQYLSAWNLMIGYAAAANNPYLVPTVKLQAYTLTNAATGGHAAGRLFWMNYVPSSGIGCVSWDVYPPHPSFLSNCGAGCCTNGSGYAAPSGWLANIITAMTTAPATSYNSGAGLLYGIGEFGTVGLPVTSGTGTSQTVTGFDVTGRPAWLTSVGSYIHGLSTPPAYCCLYDSAVLGGLGVADCVSAPGGFGVYGSTAGTDFDPPSVRAWAAVIASYG